MCLPSFGAAGASARWIHWGHRTCVMRVEDEGRGEGVAEVYTELQVVRVGDGLSSKV